MTQNPLAATAHPPFHVRRRLRDVLLAALAEGRAPRGPIPRDVLSTALGIPRTTLGSAIANGRRLLDGLDLVEAGDRVRLGV